jgi:hypothetical protein
MRRQKQDAKSQGSATSPTLLQRIRDGDQRAFSLDPAHAEARTGLGWVRHEQRHYADAEALYRRALDLKPPSSCDRRG